MGKEYNPIDDKNIEVSETVEQTTTYNIDDLNADVVERTSLIESYQKQKEEMDNQIQIQQEMIDKNKALIEELTPHLPPPAEDDPA